VVGVVDRFNLVLANSLDADDLAMAKRPEFRSAPWTGPEVIGAEPPGDAASRNEVLLSGLSGKDVERMPKYYVDLAAVAPELLRRAKPLDQLRSKTPDAGAIVAAWRRDHASQVERVVWIPLEAPQGSFTMLIDRTTAQPVDVLPISPW
jgi:hypothetical protein